jgi:hypothetical protein
MQDNTSVYGNRANSETNINGDGGGIYNSGTFTMRDNASVYGNTSARNGGGVYTIGNNGVFRLVGGTIYGFFEDDAKRNNASDRSVFFRASGTAQYGTLSGNNFTSRGDLPNTDSTIKVENGNLYLDGNLQQATQPEAQPAQPTTQTTQQAAALSGTYRFDRNASITFSGNNFTLSGFGSTFRGTYTVSGNSLTLTGHGSTASRIRGTWTIVNTNTIRDPEGDLWRR